MSASLTYELTGHGWSECTVRADERAVTVTASYLSDALGSLSDAVLAVLLGSRTAKASFDEEPGEYRWVFDRVSEDRIRVRILSFDELWAHRPDEEGKVLLDTECRLWTFAGALLSELQRLLAKYGESGYRERWGEHPFPLTQMKRIEEALRARKDERTR
jgi:hypothetical protein